MPLTIREANPEELARWDAWTVPVPGGDVYQSRAWGEYRRRHGWQPRYLLVEEQYPVLVLERPWRWIGGSGAYLSRGPIWPGGPVEAVAERLAAVAAWLGERGVDVVSSDAEIPAASGYAALLAVRGFRQIEEIQPSRHRLRRPLPPGTDEASLLASLPATVRYDIRTAERRGMRAVLYDPGAPGPGGHRPSQPDPGAPRPLEAAPGTLSPSGHRAPQPDAEARRPKVTAPGPGPRPGPGFELPADGLLDPAGFEGALQRLYDVLSATATRRRFRLGPASGFVDWGSQALGGGLALILEIRSPDDLLLGSAMFYRHGGRLTYAHAGDVVEHRRAYPGTTHLLLWRALQLCLREGCAELDLAGVDVAGMRRRPREGEPMYGLLRFKELLGGEWLDLSGNQERVIRPWRYAAGRVTGRLAGLASDLRPPPALPARAP
ncbi:MAG: lipid II:glycine glycyltransferase FemX [Candidatus Limnocylindrales bacterium]